MSRLQKKCFVGATGMHALLLLALLVGPAFFHQKEAPLDIPQITFVPSILTDEMLSNPGGARPGGVDRPQPEPPQQPTPEPPKHEEVAEPEQPKEAKRETPKIEEDEPKITSRESDAPPRSTPKRHEVKISNTKVKLGAKTSTSTAKKNPNQSATGTSNNSAFANAIRSARSNIGSGLSSGTEISMPAGQGGGSGASYANYAQEIQRRYKAAYDRALQAAGDIADGQAAVETSVVILSDGTILNSSIVRASGNTALDSLTRRVLDSIREVPPFPAGAKDSRRTFNIVFDLKPRI
jgi:TonB family protein